MPGTLHRARRQYRAQPAISRGALAFVLTLARVAVPLPDAVAQEVAPAVAAPAPQSPTQAPVIQGVAPPGARTVQAERLEQSERVVLDGVLDEPVWQRAVPAGDFVQREPINGEPATERTAVRLAYDASRLLLGVHLFDSQPQGVLANQMQRDESFGIDDSFAWAIDTFMDGRTGYFFEINPAGAMGDGLISASGGGDVNRSWDGIWIARARRTAQGWTAEIEIPFRTLNFDPTLTRWGINFRRIVRRKNEQTLWSGHARNQGLTRMLNAGVVEGLGGLSQGIGLDVIPYVVGNVASAPGSGAGAADPGGAVGFDTFYNLTPALRANVSVNTDFAETEVDQRRVNLTRFPLFFQERRDFFLDGVSYFDFGRVPGRAVTPFFSRRIGRGDDGTPQRIDVGAKLTGRAGALDVGVLQVRTAEQGGRAGEDFSVVRLRRRLFEQSQVGTLYTRRSARAGGEVDRHTVGVDGVLQTARFRGNRNLSLSGFYLWTNDPLEARDSAGFGARLSYPNDPWTAALGVLELQPGYDPAVGFVERRGYRQLNPEFEWAPRLRNRRFVRSLEFSVDWDILQDMANRPLTRELAITPLEVNTHDGGRYEFSVTPQYERLEEDFEIHDGVVLPAGGVYRFTRYAFEADTSDHRVLWVNPEVSWGGFFSGRRRDVSLTVGVRPRAGATVTFEAERSVLDLAEGSFTADVFRLGTSTQFGPWTSMTSNLQYDTLSRLLGWQFRFRWIQRPGNDLYVVYTHNWQDVAAGGPSRLTTLDNRLATKILYTVRL
ncbi:MAG: DUF5916 domain-containing protein [Vicinamibacterales bacterium]